MLNPIRKLGSIETRMALFHSNLSGSTQGTQVIHFTANISHEVYRKAANKLFQTYVALQCSVKSADDSLWFCRDVSVNDVAIQHLYIASVEQLDPIIERALDEPVNAAKSLWKLLLVSEVDTNKNVLLFTAHHSIIDANGMHELADCFFKLVSALIAGNEFPALKLCELPHAVDDLLQETNAQFNVPKVPGAPDFTGATTVAGLASCRAHDIHCPVAFRKTGWQVVTLDERQLSALNSTLKTDNIKLHSIISAAFCLAMCDANVVTPPFNFGTAVSLRFLQDNNPDYRNPLGCYMSIAANLIASASENLSALARKYDRELMHKIMTSCLNKIATDYEEFSLTTHQLAAAADFSQGAGITNMGTVGIKSDYQGLQVTDYMMLANRVSANFSIVAHCYAFGGKQHIGLVYPQPSLSDDAVELVARSLKNRLLDYSFSNNSDYPVAELAASLV
jgi:hypothetical protein